MRRGRVGLTLVEVLVVVGMLVLVLTTLLRFNSQTFVLRAHERRAVRAVAEVFPLASFKALNMGVPLEVRAWRRVTSDPWKVGLAYVYGSNPETLVGLPSTCRINGNYVSRDLLLVRFALSGKLASDSPSTVAIECRFVAYTISVDLWGNPSLSRTR